MAAYIDTSARLRNERQAPAAYATFKDTALQVSFSVEGNQVCIIRRLLLEVPDSMIRCEEFSLGLTIKGSARKSYVFCLNVDWRFVNHVKAGPKDALVRQRQICVSTQRKPRIRLLPTLCQRRSHAAVRYVCQISKLGAFRNDLQCRCRLPA